MVQPPMTSKPVVALALIAMGTAYVAAYGPGLVFGRKGEQASTAVEEQQPDPFTIRGELLDAYTYDTLNFGDFYRVIVQTSSGIRSWPVLASPEQRSTLDDLFTTRQERGGREGDWIAINPNTHVFSLDESILTPHYLKKVEKP